MLKILYSSTIGSVMYFKENVWLLQKTSLQVFNGNDNWKLIIFLCNTEKLYTEQFSSLKNVNLPTAVN